MATSIADLKRRNGGTDPVDINTLPPKQQVKHLLESNKGLIRQALPRHMNAERLLRVAQTAAVTTPGLLECYVPTLIGGIIQCASMGLEPNGALGHAYLVPFNNKKKGRKDVQVIVGYRGLIDLARRSGQIVSISAHAVREADEFEFEFGLEERLVHRPRMASIAERGQIIAVYAVAHLKDGGHAFEVMSKDQVDTIMHSSQSGGRYGPWKDHYEEMARKTAVRRLAKYLPLSVEMATATAMDEAGDEGRDQHLETALEGDYIVEGSGTEEQAEAAEEPPDSWPREVNGIWVDSAGEVYDSAKHSTGKDGRPVVRQDGTFRARRGAAKASPEVSSAPLAGVPPEDLDRDVDEPEPAAQGASETPEAAQRDDPMAVDVDALVRQFEACQDEDMCNVAEDLIHEIERGDDKLKAIRARNAARERLGLDTFITD